MRKFAAAIGAFALVTNVSTSAIAAVSLVSPVPQPDPGMIELDGMQDQCDMLALAHDTGNGDIWEGEVVLGAVSLLSGPAEVGSEEDRDITSTLLPADDATFTPNNPHIEGDPFRNGGSVNMFGYQHSGGGYWDASKYFFTAEFETVYRHEFSCNIYKSIYHPETNDNGYYEIAPDEHGKEEDAVLRECDAYNARGQRLPLPGYWGDTPHGNCVFVPGESVPEYWDPPVLQTTEAGEPIDVSQTDLLDGYEDHGMGFETADDITRMVVVCISPAKPSGGKKGIPGEWRPQNGYSGEKCTTEWYGTGATIGVTNLNTDSHNWVTVPEV